MPTVSKIERCETNLESVVHMLLFARGSIPDDGSSSSRTSGLPIKFGLACFVYNED
jgi:hypothetical protein